MDSLGFFRSTSVRLSLQFALLYTLVTACVLFAAYLLTDYEITSWMLDQLDSETSVMKSLYQNDGIDAVIAQTEWFDKLNFELYRIFLITDANGAHLAGNVASIDWDGRASVVSLSQIDFDAAPGLEAKGYVLRAVDLGGNRLILGTSTHFEAELLEALGGAFFAGFIAIMFVGLFAGISVGRRIETQLEDISIALESVSAGRIATRIPVIAGRHDDLTRVSVDINRTLGNLQNLVESQQQISADIAHDLKTPLQRLRQRLDRIGAAADLPAALAGDVDRALDAMDGLIETFHALLRISQIEAGSRRERFALVDLAAVQDRIEDAYGASAEEKGQTIVFSRSHAVIEVTGDRDLLTQMVANTVENALSHSPAGARILVALSDRSQTVSLVVSDDGPGIPEEDRDKVFRRFFRLDKSRSTPGNGLGLSLVKAIADLHGAQITLRSNYPGLRVEFVFFRSGPPAA